MSDKATLLGARFRAPLPKDLRRTDVARWMQQHPADFAALLATGKLDWAQAADLFARAGLRDADGRRLTAASAEAAWLKVRRAERIASLPEEVRERARAG